MPATKKPAMKAEDLKFNTERQRLLMKQVLDDMQEYRDTDRTYYTVNGMSTHHIVNHAIRDTKVLTAFWPAKNIRKTPQSLSYELVPGVMGKCQDALRDTLKQLAKKGYIEQMGNEHERRYKPMKALKGVTL
jgi:hypothetical protein